MSRHNTSNLSTPRAHSASDYTSSNNNASSVSDPDALRNLIVNYLPPFMDDAQFFQLFSQFGPIQSVKIIYDRVTGESRGYGFVKFQYFFSATYAISCLNRFEISGKKLKVAYANPEAAKQAYELLRLSAVAFTMQQQTALQSVYYNQMMLPQQQGSYQRQQQQEASMPMYAGYAGGSFGGSSSAWSRNISPALAPRGL